MGEIEASFSCEEEPQAAIRSPCGRWVTSFTGIDDSQQVLSAGFRGGGGMGLLEPPAFLVALAQLFQSVQEVGSVYITLKRGEMSPFWWWERARRAVVRCATESKGDV
jgi:hypothetical protein